MAGVDSKNFKIPQKETDNAKEANTNEEPKKKGMMDKIKASKPYQMYERFKTQDFFVIQTDVTEFGCLVK